MLKPATLDDLRVSITVAWAQHRKFLQTRKEADQLRQTLEDRKIIERAKGLLMDRFRLSEDAAMKRLQKQARDARQKMVDLARTIVEESDLWKHPAP